MAAILLTVVTGALDATAFLALGSVFASVMTGNLVILGVAAGSRDADLATSAGSALAGYVVGTVTGAALAHRGRRPDDTSAAAMAALCWEMVVLLAFSAVWEAAGGDPAGAVRSVLLVLAAVAMGTQSAAVRALGPPGLSTTYFTGTLTGVLAELVGRSRDGRGGRARAVARLSALVAGAGLAAWLLARSAVWLPAVPVPCLLIAVALAVRSVVRG